VSAHDEDECVVETFERFWQAVDARKFAGFTTLAALLGYLKMCAISTRIDRARLAQAWEGMAPLEGAAAGHCGRADVAEEAEERIDAARFWRIVQESVRDERERAVLYLSYALGLSPRQICARHAREFPTAADVYRIKRAALARLRRTPAITQFQA
jgi:DNA-directed RNA polymerase specialized sigma24 family protein